MTKHIPFLPSQIKIADEVTLSNPTVEFARKIIEKISKETILSCGNPKCHGKISLRKNEDRPKICFECREEIDWDSFDKT